MAKQKRTAAPKSSRRRAPKTCAGVIRGGKVHVRRAIDLPDRTRVKVVPEISPESAPTSWGRAMLRLAGKAKGLPPDFARQHDHYIYGVPKS